MYTSVAMRTILLSIYFAFLVAGLHGQARNANWVFSDGMWMELTDSSMAILPSPYSSISRSSCISDTSGQFQLLVDNSGIRGAQFNLLPGASAAELGWDTAGASYLILPKPGAPTRYCILVNEKWPNARAGYVEVDLAANGGAGGVVPPGTTWYMQHTTDKLTATTDSTETGYWVVQHADSGDAFHAFHLTGLGLDPAPVVSHAGRSYLADTPGYINADRVRPMKFSVQGDKLAAISMGIDLDTNALQLFHFNRASGALNFWMELMTVLYRLNSDGLLVPDPVGMRRFITDCEFSGDGRFMYYMYSDTSSFIGACALAQVSFEDTALMAVRLSAFGVEGCGNYSLTGMDPMGTFLLMGRDGRLYSRGCVNGAAQNYLIQFALPTVMDSLSGPNADPFYDIGTPVDYENNAVSFPNICKRYVDSSPLTTGIPRMGVNATLRVWPNPGSGLITAQLGSVASAAVARFTDATGRAVPGIWHLHPGDNTMDISGLADGIYMLHVQSADEVRQVRIVKQ